MYRIAGHLQNYAWGVPGGLTGWQDASTEVDHDLPEAELWFGAHINGPSHLTDQPGQTLRDVVDPAGVPILVKLLAAARPLSIQIHPPVDQARKSFAAQQADPSLPKLLADSMAKTEMLISLRPFSVLQGLREPALAAAILREVGGSATEAADFVEAGDPIGGIRSLLGIPADELVAMTPRLPACAASVGLRAPGVEALAMVSRDYPGDPGVLVAALLEHRVLNPGEAVFVPAGVVHAYVTGTGVEVMTSSDNVLRLGLTPKTIAVDEALAALDLALKPDILRPEPVALAGGGTSRLYAPQGAPFDVESLTEGEMAADTGRYRLVLAVGGSARIQVGEQELMLNKGQAAAILAEEPEATISTAGVVFVTRNALGSE